MKFPHFKWNKEHTLGTKIRQLHRAPRQWQLCSRGLDKGLVMFVLREVEEVDINFLFNG